LVCCLGLLRFLPATTTTSFPLVIIVLDHITSLIKFTTVFLTPSAIALLTDLRSGIVTGAIIIADLFNDSDPELFVTDS
jgi:hypothetical protein